MRSTCIAAATLFLAACGGSESGSGSAASAGGAFCGDARAAVDEFMDSAPRAELDERYGGTAVVGGIAELPDGMNTLVSGAYEGKQHQMFLHLMTLVQYDEDLEPRPYLAESWELSDDGTEVTFHLRDDVYWHDGERTDAHDVAFTFRRATDPATGFTNPQFWTLWDQSESGVEVVDSLTLRMRMEPHDQFLDPWRTTAIMPEHLLADVPPEELRRHPYGSVCPVGNGPFVFAEHRQNESWTFVANPRFPEGLGGRPFLDRYVYRIIPEQTTLLTELLTGGIDVYLAALPDQAERIRSAEHLDLLVFPFNSFTFAGWNTRVPQLEDPAVRQALTLATNRAEILEAVRRGYGIVTNTTIPPFHWAFDPEVQEALPYDPERARNLLAEAGWIDRDGDGVRENADGIPLEIVLKYNTGNQNRQQIAEIMQARLRDVGVVIRPQSVESATLTGQITNPENRDFEGFVMGFVQDFRIDDRGLFHSSSSSDPFGFAGLDHPEMDEVLEALPTLTDRDEAREYWQRAQELQVELQPFTVFYFVERLDGINRRLRDVRMDIRGEWLNTSRWWIPADERVYQGASD